MPYELWRQDDNGRRFLVATFADLAAAERRMGELTRSLHKQTYWIAACATSPADDNNETPDPTTEAQ